MRLNIAGSTRLVLVADVADQFFEDVFDGDQAGGAAVFVEHDRDVDLLQAEVVQQVAQRFGLGDVERPGAWPTRMSNRSAGCAEVA